MKRLLGAVFIAATMLLVGPAFAQQANPAPTGTTTQPAGSTSKATDTKKNKDLSPQQKKMKDCNREAKFKGLKGDQRKQFMSSCLKGD